MITEKDLKQLSEQIQNDLLCLLDDQSQETQTNACQIVVDNINGLIGSAE
jgi:hypothetical protein